MRTARVEPIILGLVGPSGGGKTTICRYLEGFGFTSIHAASPLKLAFQELTGAGERFTQQPLIEKPAAFLGGVTPRAVLEHLGNQLHEVAPLALPLMLSKRLKQMKRMHPRPWILVDGIRRATEAHVVREQGGKVIRISGKAVDPLKPCDLSQQKVADDFLVHFAPTAEELHAQLDLILRELLPPESFDGQRK